MNNRHPGQAAATRAAAFLSILTALVAAACGASSAGISESEAATPTAEQATTTLAPEPTTTLAPAGSEVQVEQPETERDYDEAIRYLDERYQCPTIEEISALFDRPMGREVEDAVIPDRTGVTESLFKYCRFGTEEVGSDGRPTDDLIVALYFHYSDKTFDLSNEEMESEFRKDSPVDAEITVRDDIGERVYQLVDDGEISINACVAYSTDNFSVEVSSVRVSDQPHGAPLDHEMCHYNKALMSYGDQ